VQEVFRHFEPLGVTQQCNGRRGGQTVG